jgi:hypothetical protein
MKAASFGGWQQFPHSNFWNEWPSQPYNQREGKGLLGFTAESLFAPPLLE